MDVVCEKGEKKACNNQRKPIATKRKEETRKKLSEIIARMPTLVFCG